MVTVSNALILIGLILLGAIIIAIVETNRLGKSEAESAADDILDELIQKEAPEPPPADLFVREEDLKPSVSPEVAKVEAKPIVEDTNPKPAKKKKHYPSKPKTKKS